MSMTRQHFEAIAETLRALKPDRGNAYAPRTVRTKGSAAYAQWLATLGAMATTLGNFNAGFSRERFLKACGDEE